MIEGSGSESGSKSVQVITDPDPGGPKKQMDPVLNPEHFYKVPLIGCPIKSDKNVLIFGGFLKVFSSHRRLSLDVLISKSLAKKELPKVFLELERNSMKQKT